jgi:hypothetical protein
MNSEVKTEKCTFLCKGCDEYTDKLDDWGTHGAMLCESCNEKYENKTGSCSLSCCLGGGCDEVC